MHHERYTSGAGLAPGQKADGYVLTCVGCPLSKVTLDIADP
ncbi:hypothetical protein ACWCQQ_45360 [Streptomyces sp. NPDC002143]